MAPVILHRDGTATVLGVLVTSFDATMADLDLLPSHARRLALHFAASGDRAAQAWLDAHPRTVEIGDRLRVRDDPRTASRLGLALGACLRSGDRQLETVARERVGAVLRATRSRAEAARQLGVPYRTLARWLAANTDLASVAQS